MLQVGDQAPGFTLPDKDGKIVSLSDFRGKKVVLYFYRKCQEVVARGVPISEIVDTGLFEKITKIKYDIPNDQLALFDDYYKEIDDKLGKLDRAF